MRQLASGGDTTSRRDIELQRRFVEAFNARDTEAMIALCDPSIEWHSTFGVVGADHRGHDGIRRWQRDLAETWGDEIRVDVEAYFDLGEHALAFYVMHGRGRRSGAEVAMPNASVFRWRHGLLIYYKGYRRREEALSDLGVSEDELEPIDP